METFRITAAGVVEGTGEVLPDRENLTPKQVGGLCRQTGKSMCSSSNLCRECAQALDRLFAQAGPPREWTGEEIEAMKARAAVRMKKR